MDYVQIEQEQDTVTEAYRTLANHGCVFVENITQETMPSPEATSCDSASVQESGPTKSEADELPKAPEITPAIVRKGDNERILRLEGIVQSDLDWLPTSDAECTRAMLEACKLRIDQLEHELSLCKERKRKREAAGDVHVAMAGKEAWHRPKLNAGPHRKKVITGLMREIKAFKFFNECADQVMDVKFTDAMSEDAVI
jgi:hypothetical protein